MEKTEMASIRLNQRMRDVILLRLMKHAFGEREKQLKEDEFFLGKDVYDDLYPNALRRKMRALPDGFLRKSSGLTVVFAGQRANVSFDGFRPIANDHDSYQGAKSYDASDELSVRYFEIEASARLLKEERDRARSMAKATLDACNTIKVLLELWPEAKPFVADFTSSKPVLALTVSIKDLNSQLGLFG
jgi:hypothetical protein